jgi:Phytanoyl-CoA dioxygenase (PhyH)
MLGRLLNRSPRAEVSDEEVEARLEELIQQNRERPDRDEEREILKLRVRAGFALANGSGKRRQVIDPDDSGPGSNGPLPEVDADQVSAGIVRAAIVRHGGILVRGLVESGRAVALAEEIDRAYAAREAHENGGSPEPGYYEEFEPVLPQQSPPHHGPVKEGGGLLAIDSPKVAFEVFEMFKDAGIRELVTDYLNERPAVSDNKTTLRKTDPKVPGGWHQDGKFLGDVNSINLWVALTHCGDDAPGLDLVPRRLDGIVEAGTGDEGFLRIVVPQERAEELAAPHGIVSPIFEPGDAMFFDHLYLHKTGSDPSQPNLRFALESWFFGPSAFPEEYTPVAC